MEISGWGETQPCLWGALSLKGESRVPQSTQTEREGEDDASGSTLDVRTEGRMGREWIWSKGSEVGEAFGGGQGGEQEVCLC